VLHAVHVRLWHSSLSLKCLGFSLGAACGCCLHCYIGTKSAAYSDFVPGWMDRRLSPRIQHVLVFPHNICHYATMLLFGGAEDGHLSRADVSQMSSSLVDGDWFPHKVAWSRVVVPYG